MLTKILVLTISVTIASCSDRHYLKHTHESHKEYRHPYQHIQVQEPSSEEYKPEHGHAYSSQRLVHQGQATYEDSHEHVPYQYKVNENSEENQEPNQEPVQQKYRFPQHVQAVRVPAHKTYYPEAHEVHQAYAPAYHAQEAYKVPAYHKVPESQEAHKDYYQPQSHDVPQKVQYQKPQEPIYVPENQDHHNHESHDEPIDYYAYPKYQYEYKVEDPHTGDNKFQHEVRDGDVVKGVYGLHEPDGSIRTVEYSSDKHHGFSAIVKHSAPGQHVHIETHHQKEQQHEHEN